MQIIILNKNISLKIKKRLKINRKNKNNLISTKIQIKLQIRKNLLNKQQNNLNKNNKMRNHKSKLFMNSPKEPVL